MNEYRESRPFVERLLEKTKAGRIHWEHNRISDEFRCVLGNYAFCIERTPDGYAFRMYDSDGYAILSASANEEIVYSDAESQTFFSLLTDLYDLARREALNIPEKLASATALLDSI